jgi:hypothetical protein
VVQSGEGRSALNIGYNDRGWSSAVGNNSPLNVDAKEDVAVIGGPSAVEDDWPTTAISAAAAFVATNGATVNELKLPSPPPPAAAAPLEQQDNGGEIRLLLLYCCDWEPAPGGEELMR